MTPGQAVDGLSTAAGDDRCARQASEPDAPLTESIQSSANSSPGPGVYRSPRGPSLRHCAWHVAIGVP